MLNMKNERNLNAVHCPFCGALMGWNSDFMASETGHLDPDTPAESDVRLSITHALIVGHPVNLLKNYQKTKKT